MVTKVAAEAAAKPEFLASDFIKKVPKGWNPEKQCLCICGPTSIGKSVFAKAHAYNEGWRPLVCASSDRAKKFNSTIHDTIILDDFGDIGKQGTTPDQLKELFDPSNNGSIHCRYKDAQLPKGTRRICLSNGDVRHDIERICREHCEGQKDSEKTITDHIAAVLKRVFILDLNGEKLFDENKSLERVPPITGLIPMTSCERAELREEERKRELMNIE